MVGWAQRGVGDGLAGEDGGAVVVLVDRVVEPGHGLPRQGAQEAVGPAAEQPGGGVVEVGDAALQVEAEGADGHPLQQVDGGEPALRRVRAGSAQRHGAGLIRNAPRSACMIQHLGDAARAGQDVPAFTPGQCGWVAFGPHQNQCPPPADTVQGSEGQRELVGQPRRGVRVQAGHVLLTTHPHETVLPYRLRQRASGRYRHPSPRCHRHHRHPAHRGQAQHRLSRGQQVHARSQSARP